MTFYLVFDQSETYFTERILQRQFFHVDDRLLNNLENDNYNLARNTSHKKLNDFLNCRFPLAFLFHILAAYAALLPLPWVTGELSKHEAASPELVWQTDLSYIFPMMAAKETMRSTRLNQPELVQLVADVLKQNPTSSRLGLTALLSLQPPSLGGLGQLPQTYHQELLVSGLKETILRQFKISDFTPHIIKADRAVKIRPVSPQFINFFISLLFLTIRFSSTFWTVWKTFSYMSSFLLLISSVHLVVDFSASSLLIQLMVCISDAGVLENGFNHSLLVNTTLLEKTNLDVDLLMIRLPIKLLPWKMTLLNICAFLSSLMEIVVLFYVGLQQVEIAINSNGNLIESVLNSSKTSSDVKQQNNLNDCKNKFGVVNYSNENFSFNSPTQLNANNVGQGNQNEDDMDTARQVHQYSFHGKKKITGTRSLIVVGLLSFALDIGIRMPLLIDMFNVYWYEREYQCLVNILFYILIQASWMLMWFGFIVKQRWIFRVRCPQHLRASVSSATDQCLRVSGNSCQNNRTCRLVSDSLENESVSNLLLARGSTGFRHNSSDSKYVGFSPVQVYIENDPEDAFNAAESHSTSAFFFPEQSKYYSEAKSNECSQFIKAHKQSQRNVEDLHLSGSCNYARPFAISPHIMTMPVTSVQINPANSHTTPQYSAPSQANGKYTRDILTSLFSSSHHERYLRQPIATSYSKSETYCRTKHRLPLALPNVFSTSSAACNLIDLNRKHIPGQVHEYARLKHHNACGLANLTSCPQTLLGRHSGEEIKSESRSLFSPIRLSYIETDNSPPNANFPCSQV